MATSTGRASSAFAAAAMMIAAGNFSSGPGPWGMYPSEKSRRHRKDRTTNKIAAESRKRNRR